MRTAYDVGVPGVAARCGELQETSARLREHARALCAASALLRRLVQGRGRAAAESPRLTSARAQRGVGLGLRCMLCAQRVSPRELARAAGRPIHAVCYDSQLRDLEAAVIDLLGAANAPLCRACVARTLSADREYIYAVSARLLPRRLIRSSAALCGECRRPRLVFVSALHPAMPG